MKYLSHFTYQITQCPLFPQELLTAGSAVVLWDSSHGSSLSRDGLATGEHCFYQGMFRLPRSIGLWTIHSTVSALNNLDIFVTPKTTWGKTNERNSLDNQVFESLSVRVIFSLILQTPQTFCVQIQFRLNSWCLIGSS